jgi:hypothetical protein
MMLPVARAMLRDQIILRLFVEEALDDAEKITDAELRDALAIQHLGG